MHERQQANQRTRLAAFEGLSTRHRQRLEALRIVAAEDLLAMSTTAENRERLAVYLGASRDEFDTLLTALRDHLVQRDTDDMGIDGGEDAIAPPPRQPDPQPEPESKRTATDKTHRTMVQEEMPPTPLTKLKPQPLSSKHLSKLRRLNVTTAEDLISMSAMPKNRRRLETYLDVADAELKAILAEIRSQLDPQLVRDMLRPEPGGPRHGVLDPIPAAKRRGRRPRSRRPDSQDDTR